MQRTSDEALFAAFQHRRCVDSLTTLFRRRADELLRLAVFLAPRPSDAEDLVQATFLSAIARAETYHQGHRVMSWLCGILTNHARMLRRAERRTQPAHTAPVEMVEDPVSAALHQELRHALAQSITALAEPYRSVLTLHLKDGLNSKEISRRLDRPPATVRKQMARAIQQLRTVLPTGLATGVLVRMNPAQIAERAAEAAQFVDPQPGDGQPGDGQPGNGQPGDGQPGESLAPRTRTAATTSKAALITAAALLGGLGLWLAGVFAPEVSAAEPRRTQVADVDAAPPRPTAVTTAPERPEAEPAASERRAAAGVALTVTATAPGGAPHTGVEILCLLDDGRGLTTRLSHGQVARATTDAAGRAHFASLPAGRHDITIAGSVPKRSVVLHEQPLQVAVQLPARTSYAGTVTDPAGAPVAGATVFVSETSGRGDLGVPLAVTAADGSYRGSCLLPQGRIFARHPDLGQSVCRRLEPGRELSLQLEATTGSVTVTARDEDGAALPDCYIALVPKSQSMSFYVPYHGRTDQAGQCTLPDPGPRQATVIAQAHGMAPAHVDLPPNDQRATVILPTGTTIAGVARAADGSPLANREVLASVAGSRTNEPIAPLLALHTRTDRDGNFRIVDVPRARLQLRITSNSRRRIGPPMSQFVVAGLDVDTRDGAQSGLQLIAHVSSEITGVLRDEQHRGIAGWHVMAVPELGTAQHRMFRRRIAITDQDGRFALPAIASGEAYQLGVWPPDRWWPNELSWPVAFARARSGEPCEMLVDQTRRPQASLTCQALLPNGHPSRRASFELRAVAMHAPLTCSADAAGKARFEQLPAGDYWLVVLTPGLGSRTLAVHVDEDQALDLGSLQLQPAARVVARLLRRPRGKTNGLRVVGKSVLGDKFVSATSGGRGVAMLPPLPPGESLLLLHGPGIAPRVVRRRLEPGRQWLDLDVEPANPVTLRFPFAIADNPFVLNGPLHVRIFDAAGGLLLEDYVGATAVRGRFDLSTGLRPGRYRIVARSIWNASADGELVVPAGEAIGPDGGRTSVAVFPLQL